jgi:hypothetical protein
MSVVQGKTQESRQAGERARLSNAQYRLTQNHRIKKVFALPVESFFTYLPVVLIHPACVLRHTKFLNTEQHTSCELIYRLPASNFRCMYQFKSWIADYRLRAVVCLVLRSAHDRLDVMTRSRTVNLNTD